MGEGPGLPQLLFSSIQGVSNDTSSLETERGFEELPLCSCRMEAPKIDRISERAGHKCMATESVDGEVGLGAARRDARGSAPAPSPQPHLFSPGLTAHSYRAVTPRSSSGRP